MDQARCAGGVGVETVAIKQSFRALIELRCPVEEVDAVLGGKRAQPRVHCREVRRRAWKGVLVGRQQPEDGDRRGQLAQRLEQDGVMRGDGVDLVIRFRGSASQQVMPRALL